METNVLIQIIEAAEMKEQAAKRFDSLCSKYKVTAFDKESFIVAMLSVKMDNCESLCEKYNMPEYDRNNIARSLIMALTTRNSIRIGRLIK